MNIRKIVVVSLSFCLLILLGVCGCDQPAKIISISYESYASPDAIITYSILQEENNSAQQLPTLSVAISSRQGNFADSCDIEYNDFIRALESCSGYTLWNPNAGDIDSRIGELSLTFNDGNVLTYSVVGPLEGKFARGESDKVALYITNLANDMHMNISPDLYDYSTTEPHSEEAKTELTVSSQI